MIWLLLISSVFSIQHLLPEYFHIVLDCVAKSKLEIQQLILLEQETEIDIWSHGFKLNAPIHIRIKNAKEMRQIREIFSNCQIQIPNVHQWIKDSKNMHSYSTAYKEPIDDFFIKFQTYSAIGQKLIEWQEKYPYLISLNNSIGKSYEGRDIPAIKITNLLNFDPKKAVWFNSGQHAREWIGPSTVMFIAHKLLTSQDSFVMGILNQTEIYITPMMNPDGYEFTMAKGGDRMWRKNRKRNWDGSYGVDLNRNWDDHFGVVGTSKIPRSETYRGTHAFSEPETKAISDWILSIPNRHAGIDFHSFGQLILRSWGWTDTPSKNENVLKELGDGMQSAIYKSSKVNYTSEISASLYAASGCTDDWMTSKAGMVGFTIELRDTGKYGFQLPPNQIVPVGNEIWDSMKFYFDFILSHEIPPNTINYENDDYSEKKF